MYPVARLAALAWRRGGAWRPYSLPLLLLSTRRYDLRPTTTTTRHELRTSYELRATSYELRAPSCELRAASCELRAASCELLAVECCRVILRE
jgi:hypothetical protein